MAKIRVDVDDHVLNQLIGLLGDVPTWIIRDGVLYGIYIELGTTRMAARPSLVPAFDKVAKQLPRAVGLGLERLVSPADVIAKGAFDIQALWASRVPVDTGAFRNSITAEEK